MDRVWCELPADVREPCVVAPGRRGFVHRQDLLEDRLELRLRPWVPVHGCHVPDDHGPGGHRLRIRTSPHRHVVHGVDVRIDGVGVDLVVNGDGAVRCASIQAGTADLDLHDGDVDVDG